MFETIEMAPPDPILGLTEAFNKDTNGAKINLSVGVYKDANGQTPILESVKQARQRVLDTEKTKSYKPINGDPAYGAAVRAMLFGAGHEIVTSGRATTAHTPGGTGALRVAGDYLHSLHPKSAIWVSDPTWANHANIFEAAGLTIKKYPYFDAATNSLAWEKMIAALGQVPAGDAVLLHGCCHNPTGVDPLPAQWGQIADVLAKRGALPLVDFAYQGFADGIDEDAAGLHTLCKPGCELLICSSFSKNFGLYNERVGALTVVAGTPQAAEAVMSHMKRCIRCNYSNPPAHGAAVVTTILNDAALKAQWQGEVKQMRDRINAMRRVFVERLAAKGVKGDYSFINRQRGMFSFSGLNKDQVQALRDKHAIYIVGSGRINVAGMTEANIDALCEAIAGVV